MANELPFVAPFEGVAFDEPFRQPDDTKLETAGQLDRRSGAARHLHASAADVDNDRCVR